ncbi:DUF1588 domain-containing protein [Paraliomyxa miuraensis]|uniref:DUF1588 domain-containing protein n=1 Tax=Paraliomyxa miuraensis TaxID=376150 RepID=UPI00225352DE|nr:DUF1588 domain-containing protein [Paraliomyxa miuraensis]MCX4245123.1 DUF1588 domain-containing protein [Paraliomyxa miuraensis]
MVKGIESEARRGRWALGALAVSLMMAGCYQGGPQIADEDDPEEEEDGQANLVGPGTCVDTDEFFKEKIWAPVLSQRCIACHNPMGVAGHTDLVLQMSDYPGYLEVNKQTVANVARLEIDGMPLLLAKPSAAVEHGGGLQIQDDSEEYALLGEMIDRFRAPTHCRHDGDINKFFAGIQQLDEEETLRKATFLLASRMPTAEELDAVRGGGIDALDSVLDTVLREDEFYVRMKEIVNDMLHTDAYRIGDDAVETVDLEMFPMAFWFDDIEDADTRNLMRRRANDAIAREPLEVVEYVLRNDLPFTEVFTADYTIVNPFSARSYGLDLGMFTDPNDESEKLPWTFEGMPQSGILTTSVFLNRYPTTPTNRNRGRARYFYEFFLATDVMRLAARPIDATQIQTHNPTLNAAACNSCHNNIDPIAGAFQNWDDRGRYRPLSEGWYGDMVAPGFGDKELPYEETPRALSWLAEEMLADPKFALAMVHLVYTGLTGQDPLEEPMELEDVDYLARIRAFEAQDFVFKQVAEKFVGSGYDLRVIVKELVKTPYFRALGSDEALDEQRYMELADMGTARLLPPEALHRRLVSTLGVGWQKDGTNVLLSGNYYKFFYGGIDSVSVTDRLTEMNGVMASVVDRMSNEMACTITAVDFTRAAEQRVLFPEVELTDLPGAPGAEQAIRSNLVYMYDRLLGESLTPDDPEIDRAYGVFSAVWQDGQAGLLLEENPYPVALPNQCRATTDPATGEAIPADLQIIEDPDYTVRAWMAVTTYLLGDFRFLYE